MQHGGGKSNWGAIDKTGLHNTPEVVDDALGPIPTTPEEKELEPESKFSLCIHGEVCSAASSLFTNLIVAQTGQDVVA